jgi:hypothetical protein
MRGTRSLAALASIVVVLGLGAAHASATARANPLTVLQGAVTTGAAGPQVIDGACPNTTDRSYPRGTEDPHQIWSVQIGADGEQLAVSLCWQVTGALGGNFLDRRSTFAVTNATGSVRGTATGFIEFSHDTFDFTLGVTRATGSLQGATGSLTLFGCELAGGTILGAVRTQPLDPATYPRPYPKACFA